MPSYCRPTKKSSRQPKYARAGKERMYARLKMRSNTQASSSPSVHQRIRFLDVHAYTHVCRPPLLAPQQDQRSKLRDCPILAVSNIFGQCPCEQDPFTLGSSGLAPRCDSLVDETLVRCAACYAKVGSCKSKMTHTVGLCAFTQASRPAAGESSEAGHKRWTPEK